MEPRDVEWTNQGEAIVGQLYLPDGVGPFAAVVLCHGFAGIPAYVKRFAESGYAALTFDHRGFGGSQGERGRLLPDKQVDDVDARLELPLLGDLAHRRATANRNLPKRMKS